MHELGVGIFLILFAKWSG